MSRARLFIGKLFIGLGGRFVVIGEWLIGSQL